MQAFACGSVNGWLTELTAISSSLASELKGNAGMFAKRVPQFESRGQKLINVEKVMESLCTVREISGCIVQ